MVEPHFFNLRVIAAERKAKTKEGESKTLCTDRGVDIPFKKYMKVGKLWLSQISSFYFSSFSRSSTLAEDIIASDEGMAFVSKLAADLGGDFWILSDLTTLQDCSSPTRRALKRKGKSRNFGKQSCSSTCSPEPLFLFTLPTSPSFFCQPNCIVPHLGLSKVKL